MVFDEPRPGDPKTASTDENVNKVYDLVSADRRLKIRELAEYVGISKDRVYHILHEILGIRKKAIGEMSSAFAVFGKQAEPFQSSVWSCFQPSFFVDS